MHINYVLPTDSNILTSRCLSALMRPYILNCHRNKMILSAQNLFNWVWQCVKHNSKFAIFKNAKAEEFSLIERHISEIFQEMLLMLFYFGLLTYHIFPFKCKTGKQTSLVNTEEKKSWNSFSFFGCQYSTSSLLTIRTLMRFFSILDFCSSFKVEAER